MVEWKTIEELGSYFGGLTGKTKEDFEDGNAKFITYMNVFSNPSLEYSVVGVVKINEGEKQNKVQKGDILFTGSSETPEDTGMSCVVTDELFEDFYMNSFCFGLRLFSPELYNLHFFKHLLRSESVRKSIAKTASGVTRFNISKARFSKIKIPIPPLSEQTRIVGILDTFTASIDNLKEQIAQRRKQYEYYRDQLLDLEGKEGVEMKRLKEIANIKVGPFGSLIHKNDYIKGGIPLVNPVHMINGSIIKDESFSVTHEMAELLSNYALKANDIVFARRGEIGRCAIVQKEDDNYLCGTGSLIVRFKEKVNSKFMLYFFQTPLCKNYLEKSAIGGTMLNINCDIVGKMDIFIISLEKQNHIVSILDTFEASIANLESQLKEREKQYEYYRNKLLTFE